MTTTKQSRRRVAVVIGGAECAAAEVEMARALCAGMDVEFYAVNDQIATFPDECIAVTLHPDKLHSLSSWLPQRQMRGYSEPIETWTHEQSRHPDRSIRKLHDLGGSSGLFGVAVAARRGHDRIVLCGVPMTAEAGHYVRNQPWREVVVFWRSWENALPDIRNIARSFSGRTRELLGAPTREWLAS